jgi:hypothetical protein
LKLIASSTSSSTALRSREPPMMYTARRVRRRA